MIPKKISVLPGFSLTLGTSLLFIGIILLLPMIALIFTLSGMTWQDYFAAITHPQVVASYRLTLLTAAVASILNGFIGLLFAWVIVRYDFWGRSIIDALIDLPFALPTAVAGITLSTLFASNGIYGQFFSFFGIEIANTELGIMIAMMFTSIPFVVRSVQPVLEALPSQLEEAASTLGASAFQIFSKVIFPMILPAWITGIGLSFARSLGEYGAVIFIAGNKPYLTEVTSLVISYRLSDFDFNSAAAIASVVLITALILLLIINAWQFWFYKKYQGAQS